MQSSKHEAELKESINPLTDKDTALQQLSQLRQCINDDTFNHDIRKKASEDFIELLQSTISVYDLLTQELSDLQLNVFTYENPESIQNDLSLRFIVFLSEPEIFGTLERSWTFLEVSQGSEKYIQPLYEKTSETPTNCIRVQDNGKEFVLLYGGTTTYSPRPLFISFWELSGKELIPGKLINHTVSAENSVRDYENMLIFEGEQEQWYFDAAPVNLPDPSLLSVKLGTNTEIVIIFKNGEFIAQKI